MQKVSVFILFLTILLVIKGDARVIEYQSEIEEPRIFFKQIIQGSGLFPIEINVPGKNIINIFI
jgi:hypothetical protein